MQDPEQPMDDSAALAQLNTLAQKTADAGRVENNLDDQVRWKTFRFKVESVEEDGTFTGYASVWGVIDSEDEVVDKGSAARSIKNNPNFVLLWQHNITTPVGFNASAAEDEHGLLIRGELMLDCEQGRYAYAFLKKAQKLKGKAGLSIGFRIIQDSFVKHKDGKTRRHFTEIAILETSIVTFAANPEAFVMGVKSAFVSKQADESKHALYTINISNPSVETVQKLFESMNLQKDDGKAAAENLQIKGGSMAASATDFSAALAQQQKKRDMYEDRNDIDAALHYALSSIHNAEDLETDGKKSAIRKAYTDHAGAMGDWHVKAYFDGEKAASGSEIETKSAGEPDYTKAKMPKAARAKMVHALDLHSSAIAMHNKAMTICKSMMDGSDDDAGSSDEMGAMGDKDAIEATKAADGADAALAADIVASSAWLADLRASFKLAEAT